MSSATPVQERIRAVGDGLSTSGQRIARVLRDDPASVIGMTVSDLASESGTSVGSVVRFCQDLGFRGFQDLKIHLAGDVSSFASGSTDSSEGLPGRVLLETAAALRQAAQSIDAVAFGQAVELMSGARRILVAGVGTSAPVAADAAYRLTLAGVPAVSVADAHGQHVAAALLTSDDVCLTVSHTGQTQETLAVTTAARDAGAGTIGLSSFSRSPLAQLCDVLLVAGSAETGFRLEAMTSRFLHLAVIDALYVALTERHPERSQRAQTAALAALASHRL